MCKRLLLGLCFLVGCGGDDAAGGGADANPGGGADANPGVTPDSGSAVDPLDFPPPASGFQVRTSGVAILPDQDIEYCDVLRLPGTADATYYVNRLESKMSAGSHHLIVTAIPSGSSDEAGLTEGSRQTCPFGARNITENVVPVIGSQHLYHDDVYPAGVGRVFHGGQYLIFDYHYFNTNEAPLTAVAAVNFHTTDVADVTRIADNFGLYNFTIDTPPGETRTFIGECNFTSDVMVWKLTRHTHQWGRDFSVWYRGGASDATLAWSSPDYETTEFVLPAGPVLMRAGEGFRFSCTYENTTSANLKFGVKATDEMCILFGTWWKVNATDTVGSQDCWLTTIGADGIARP